jgi:hypothetical protein
VAKQSLARGALPSWSLGTKEKRMGRMIEGRMMVRRMTGVWRGDGKEGQNDDGKEEGRKGRRKGRMIGGRMMTGRIRVCGGATEGMAE